MILFVENEHGNSADNLEDQNKQEGNDCDKHDANSTRNSIDSGNDENSSLEKFSNLTEDSGDSTKEALHAENTNYRSRLYNRYNLTRIRRAPKPRSFYGRVVGLFGLLNIPLIFRPIAEILLGVMIAVYFKNNGDISKVDFAKALPISKIILVVVVSIMLFMFSSSLNNIIQLKNDRKLYRHKPLINGAIPLWVAWLISIFLLLGAGFIGFKIGNGTFLVMIALTFSLLLYNILSRQDKILSAVMFALCSLFNIYLGTSAIIEVPGDIIAIFDSTVNEFAVNEILLFFPLSIFLFFLGVMLVSTLEEAKPSPIKLAISNILILIGLIVPIGYKYVKVYLTGNVMSEIWTLEFIFSMFLAGCLFLPLVVIMTIAAYENSPRNLHRIVVFGKFGVIWLCASILVIMDFVLLGLIVALSLVPAIMLYLQVPDPAKRRKIES